MDHKLNTTSPRPGSAAKPETLRSLTSPARSWSEGFPVGDGVQGAMVWGHTGRERILLCRHNLWLPLRQEPLRRAPLASVIPHLRARLKAGDAAGAEAAWKSAAKAAGFLYVHSDPCHPAGELVLATAGSSDPVTDYRRWLDPLTGIAHCEYRKNGALLRRSVSCSRDDGVVVVEFESDTPTDIAIELTPVPYADQTAWLGTTYPGLDAAGWAGQTVPLKDLVAISSGVRDGQLYLDGRYTRSQGGWSVLAHCVGEGGGMRDPGGLCYRNIRRLTILLAISDRPLAAAFEDLRSTLQRAAAKAPAAIASPATHAELVNRCTITLEEAVPSPPPAHAGTERPALADMYRLARHLFVSCAAAHGEWPPHLQGLWTGTWRPPWFGNYTLDENVQMCHWFAEAGNLGELTLPLHRMLQRSRDGWRQNARDIFGSSGIAAPLMQSSDPRADCAEWMLWSAGAGWLAEHAWDHWLFTRDEPFLRDVLLPLLGDIVDFWESWLVPGPDGRLHSSPSLSPENSPAGTDARLAVDATLDIAVAAAAFARLPRARAAAGLQADPGQRCSSLLRQLPDFRITAEGALAEWIDPRFADRHAHRHVSHLVALFPMSLVSPRRHPLLAAAARRTLEAHAAEPASTRTAWSAVHQAGCWARLGDGVRALSLLHDVVDSCRMANGLLSIEDPHGRGRIAGDAGKMPVWQLDASLGLAAVMQEMLIQSDEESVSLWPALPPAHWPRGNAGPFATRCGVQVRLRWDVPAGEMHAELTAKRETRIQLHVPAGWTAPAVVAVNQSPIRVVLRRG